MNYYVYRFNKKNRIFISRSYLLDDSVIERVSLYQIVYIGFLTSGLQRAIDRPVTLVWSVNLVLGLHLLNRFGCMRVDLISEELFKIVLTFNLLLSHEIDQCF